MVSVGRGDSDGGGSVSLGLSSDLSRNKSILCLLPVDNLPHVREVLWPRVLVINVVSVLPDVHVEDWDDVRTSINDEVLVVRGAIVELTRAAVKGEPSPATSLNASSAHVEDLDELVLGAPSLHDSVEERSTLGEVAVSDWAKRLPEELVVEVTTTIEFDFLLESDGAGEVTTGLRLGELLNQGVEIVDIRSVVLTVVEVELLAGHDGLERADFVRKVLQGDTHG